MGGPLTENLAEDIECVLFRIKRAALRAGREPRQIRLIAVSKTVPAERLKEAFDCGLADFGENRIQEARTKIGSLAGLPVRWHFLGHLQTNKAGEAVKMGFELLHSVDSERLLGILENQAAKAGRTQRALIEVKLSAEPSKHGVTEGSFFDLLRASREAPHIRIEGLMTVPPYSSVPEEARPYFARLRVLKERAQTEGFDLPELSMGMSHDFEVAIEEGATMVRIGTAIFGGRTK